MNGRMASGWICRELEFFRTVLSIWRDSILYPLPRGKCMKSTHDDIQDLNGFYPAALRLAVFGALLLSGCFVDFSDYGRYQPSREMGEMFESGRLPPEYNCYYAGSDKDPEAVIGLDPAYTLMTIFFADPLPVAPPTPGLSLPSIQA